LGAYAEFYVGGILVQSTKNDLNPDLVGLFYGEEFHKKGRDDSAVPKTISERWAPSDEDSEEESHSCFFYQTNLSNLIDRLEYLGYSYETSRKAFEKWKASTVSWKRETGHDHEEGSLLGEMWLKGAKDLESLTFEAWQAAVEELAKVGRRKNLSAQSEQAFRLIGDSDIFEVGPNYDLLITIRLLTGLFPPDTPVLYDLTDLVLSEYLDESDDANSYLRSHEFGAAFEIFRNSKTIVLVEGKSDIRILKSSMEKLFSRISDRFTFFDYEQFGIPGGSGNLVNLVKSFVAAGVANRIIAIFDNDTAGLEAMNALKNIALPRNLKAMQLPDFPLLENYPTLGPNGAATMNICNCAAGIELYLGEDLLRKKTGNLSRVRWTGFSAKTKQYQGEVEDKEFIQNSYLQKLESTDVETLRLDRNMDQIFEICRTLIRAFELELADEIIERAEKIFG
jgi:hypothetical protein